MMTPCFPMINPILSFKLFSAKMTIGEDICMLTVGDRKPRPRLYTVRACATTERSRWELFSERFVLARRAQRRSATFMGISSICVE